MRAWLAAALLAPMLAWGTVPMAALQLRADRLVQEGNDWPEQALAGLDQLAVEATDPAAQRVLRLSRGLVAARAGRDADADAAVEALRAVGPGDPMAAAGAQLVLAVQADTRGRFDIAAEHAEAAVDLYRSACSAAAAACERRAWWRAYVVLYTRAISQGNRVAARSHMMQALAIAQEAGDLYLQAWNHATLASLSAHLGEFDARAAPDGAGAAARAGWRAARRSRCACGSTKPASRTRATMRRPCGERSKAPCRWRARRSRRASRRWCSTT